MTGTFLDLLRPFGILGGLTTFALFTYQGAHFLTVMTILAAVFTPVALLYQGWTRLTGGAGLVARAGFEPAISGLKGRRPSPLDERARADRSLGRAADSVCHAPGPSQIRPGRGPARARMVLCARRCVAW